MSEIPEMPTNWWPDSIMVRGTVIDDEHDERLEVSFMMSREDAELPQARQAKLEEMRLALWQAMHSRLAA